MPFSDIQVQIQSRETSTSYPTLSWLENDLQTECNEEVYGVGVIEDGAGPTAISLGSIAKGRFLFIDVVEDTTNGREPLDVMINGSGNDPITGTMIAYEADSTTGITSVHITNNNTNDVKYRYYISGDVVT